MVREALLGPTAAWQNRGTGLAAAPPTFVETPVASGDTTELTPGPSAPPTIPLEATPAWKAPAPADVTHPGSVPIDPAVDGMVLSQPRSIQLPALGKWMYAKTGHPANWLGMKVQGKELQEPINMVFVDPGATSAQDATKRLEDSMHQAGYESREGHSTGYRAWIGGQYYDQLPLTFSNHLFVENNNHGRIFGPVQCGGAWVFVGAFSREKVDLPDFILHPGQEHQYASFNQARDGVASALNQQGAFKAEGTVAMNNAIVGSPTLATGDHDGRAVVLVNQ